MTTPDHRRRLTASSLAVLCLLALVACGNGVKTGGGVNTKVTGPVNTCGVLGCATTPPPQKTTAPVVRHTTAPPTVRKTAKPTPHQTQPVAQPFNIDINGDKSGKTLIDPPQSAVYAGTPVVWHNRDTKPRGVQATNGAFNSGLIAPGGSYTWIGKPGNFPFRDITRPYVTGTLQVIAR